MLIVNPADEAVYVAPLGAVIAPAATIEVDDAIGAQLVAQGWHHPKPPKPAKPAISTSTED